MCILFIYQNPDPSPESYRLILATNRDEFFARPAKAAHFWNEFPDCLGGTDMEPGKEGGTWLGLNIKTGKAGVILNLSGDPEKSLHGKGRGSLITDYLTTNKTTLLHANELQKINQEYQLYNPYTLVLIDLKNTEIYCISSVKEFEGPKLCTEEILGFGNSRIEKPYKKVMEGKLQFKQVVVDASISNQEQLIENLINFLKSTKKHLPDPELQKRQPKAFNELSSIFVEHKEAGYGTRTHTIIFVDYYHQATFVEETMLPNKTWKRQKFFKKMQYN